MHASQLEQVQKILEKALGMAPDAREAYLKTTCADDKELYAGVKTMLKIHQLSSDRHSLITKQDNSKERSVNSLIGSTIGRYRIESCIGVGGMGAVYKAHDSQSGQYIALKCLSLEHVANRTARLRFVNEARAVARLDHPNICEIHEIGEMPDGQLFMAMTYYEGMTLDEIIKGGPINHLEAVNIIHKIALGLHAAHQQDIIHRDIKPTNILITNDGDIKILDFGVAKILGVDLTGTGISIGTAAYMAPEQCTGNRVHYSTDIWSLGAILYEMLTGDRLFKGKNAYATIYSILNTKPRFPENIPVYLQNILERSLTRKIENRFHDMDEFISHLTLDLTTKNQQEDGIPEIESSDYEKVLFDFLSQELIRFIGPITPFIIKKEAAKHKTMDELLHSLASYLDDKEQRDVFIQSVCEKMNNYSRKV